MDEKQLSKDRLRFEKNKVSSSLTYLGILFNVFYFVSIYKLDVGNYYYSWIIGASIIYNLLFLLTAFLCSEGVKSYNFNFAVTLIVIGALQFIRIFVIPMQAHSYIVTVAGDEMLAMTDGQFAKSIAYLVISGVICIIAGIVGIIKSRTLKAYEAELAAKNA